MMTRLLNRLFRCEEINGANRCPTYLYRWIVLSTRFLGVYLHHFVGDDWSLDLHDHPKRFVSIGLAGGYVEQTARGEREYVAPWLRTFPAKHAHRLRLGRFSECWTLVFVFKAERPWGFWHAGVWLPWREYVVGKYADLADLMASCR
jgi:hypothetical protein